MIQEPLSSVALGLKFTACMSVHPSISCSSQIPSPSLSLLQIPSQLRNGTGGKVQEAGDDIVASES